MRSATWLLGGLGVCACGLGGDSKPTQDAPPPAPAPLVVDMTTPPPPATPQPLPDPPFVRPPIVEPALDGAWPIKEFRVELAPVTDAWLRSFDASFGLELGLGVRDDHALVSTIELGTNCEGMCKPSEFAQRIQEASAERIFSNLSREAARVEWVVRPTELAPGRWWMHLRGLDEGGRPMLERVEVATIVPEAEGGWFYCSLTLREAELARFDELAPLCKSLVPAWVGEQSEPVEARFGGKYPVAGVLLDIPTPPDFRFQRYVTDMPSVEFRGESMRELNLFSVSVGCNGTCKSERLRQNLTESDAESLADLREQGRTYALQKPLTEVTPGRFVRRIHHPVADHFPESAQVEVWALRRGVDRWAHCRARLDGAQLRNADAFEQRCLNILEPW